MGLVATMKRAPSHAPSAAADAAPAARSDDMIFVRDMLSELDSIARRHKFDMLAYLIGMAQFEAADLLERERGLTTKRR